MLIFDISEFKQNTTKILDAALTDEVIINNKNGDSYKLFSLKNNGSGKSPFEDIPYVTADITTQEIVELLRESRAGI